MTKRTVKELEDAAKQELVDDHDEVVIEKIKARLSTINSVKSKIDKATKRFDESGKNADEDVVKSLTKELETLDEDYTKFTEQGIKVVA